MTDDLDKIWKYDLLGRREDADRLQAYIESISAFQLDRGSESSFIIAIDAPYGVGKSFFLTRLAKQLSLTHPVAYVDAWADDIMNEPLTALY